MFRTVNQRRVMLGSVGVEELSRLCCGDTGQTKMTKCPLCSSCRDTVRRWGLCFIRPHPKTFISSVAVAMSERKLSLEKSRLASKAVPRSDRWRFGDDSPHPPSSVTVALPCAWRQESQKPLVTDVTDCRHRRPGFPCCVKT